MKNAYKFCSVCGDRVRLKKKHLRCVSCNFVNYRNARPTATAIIIHKNKILLTKRNNKPFKGWWDLPGGFLDRGEKPEDGIRREMQEELGLGIKLKNILGIYPGTYPSRHEPFHILSVVYVAEPVNKKLKILDKEEIAGFRWFSKKELPSKIAFDSNQIIIKDFKKIWK